MISANEARQLVATYNKRQKILESIDKCIRQAAFEGLTEIPFSIAIDENYRGDITAYLKECGYQVEVQHPFPGSELRMLLVISWEALTSDST